MTIHRSLVPQNKLVRHRNVLARDERIKILVKEEKWEEGDSVFGLPKVKHILHKVRAKPKKEEAAVAAGTEAAAAPAAAPGAKTGVATAKPTAAGAKPAAPAAAPAADKKAKGEAKK